MKRGVPVSRRLRKLACRSLDYLSGGQDPQSSPWPGLPTGDVRIYHVHVMKTGGTSLNAAFWGLSGLSLRSVRFRRRMRRNGYVFVKHHRRWIEEGRYFYASSHLPTHELALPPRTFTVTILRNPVKRLLSHYRMLRWARDEPEARRLEPGWDWYGGLPSRMRWVGRGFGDFLERIPKNVLLGQLYMFSSNYEPEEAVQTLASCSAICFTESLARDVRGLSRRLGLKLELHHERKGAPMKSPVPERDLERARRLLASEFRMLELVRERCPQVLHADT